MIQTQQTNQITKEDLEKRLSSLYDIFEKNNDQESRSKIIHLLKKLNNSEYMIGFSGHFSAGKSSMINELIGESLLPSSPIPTSANLVKVKQGREYARVYYRDGKIIEYPHPYDYDVIKSYAKDGEAIESIEISHDIKKLPEQVIIMDTPGIDSTDDAHRVSTESALHLADILFYVMDYNHVLSELNFQFTKELTDRNKTVYLFVNQVDKHKETELPFASFKQGVEEAFQNWNVAYSDIFYTTLKEPDHEHNQFEQVQQLLHEKMANKDQLLLEGVFHSARQIILEHIAFLDDQNAVELEDTKEKLRSLSAAERDMIPDRIEELNHRLTSFAKEREKIETEFIEEIETILSNAILMPFQTRDLAKRFVESVQADFKVGLLFSKNKTEKEREERLQAFFHDVKEKMSTQLEWHLKDFVGRYVESLRLTKQPTGNELATELTPDELKNLVKPGARVTGEYILTYTDDVGNYIKRKYKQKAVTLLHDIFEQLKAGTAKDETHLKNELKQYEVYSEAFATLKKFEVKRVEAQTLLENIIDGKVTVNSSESVENLLSRFTERVEVSSTEEILHELKNRKEEVSQVEKKPDQEQKEKKGSSDQAIHHLENAHELIKPITGLSVLAKDIQDKAHRLKHKHFTVALFGAFSAGKSSFANALMGKHALPVSPNPTTATINKITFPTEEHKHGTVLVKIKSTKQLLDDINHSLHIFGEQAENLDESLEKINSSISNIEKIDAKEKPHFSFLKAVVAGFENISVHLDQILTTDMDGFNEYVAKEEKACFVEWIELYYDCPLTQQGITLVDTPGADSINARHTGVAFEYIKNADAILFVTYYNHAFSKADREFLIQLGRVKDTFSMDKMFFVINAADLANTIDELEDVKEYVGSQLMSYGIRFPRLYTVSSRAALLEKLNVVSDKDLGILQSSGIQRFETDFHSFVIDELTEVAVNEGYVDIQRATAIINSYIQSAKEDKDIKRSKLEKAKDQHAKMKTIVTSVDYNDAFGVVEQEVKELTFYIKQRVFLRISDMFKEAFNPSSLREDGRDLKNALQSCLVEFLESVGFDLAQEMRATSLRIESFISKRLHGQLGSFNEQIKSINSNMSISESVKLDFESIEFKNGLANEELSRYKRALGLFKNPKSFFEKNEKKQMQDELEVLLDAPISSYLEENQANLVAFYKQQFNNGLQVLQKNALMEIHEYFDGVTKILSEDIDIESLEQVHKTLKGYYTEHMG
ncbi:dynamin family protein [Fredinandcohnia sp. QZ13]|uniref:dynamin family protein n=1 Tax=Fredinandcohnia sp. QZ13 TaxID=3073144 RepID=UPI0028535229|nr:dynamin family protein [Fredinandcohnia sp. QZ13]MDR4888641.1 dynamin family protein [Fredinandcohnia sp. QZ13]